MNEEVTLPETTAELVAMIVRELEMDEKVTARISEIGDQIDALKDERVALFGSRPNRYTQPHGYTLIGNAVSSLMSDAQ